MTVFCIRSLLNLILVHAVLNNFYFCSFSLLKFLYCLVFVSLQLEKNSCSRKTKGNNFRFSFSCKNSSASFCYGYILYFYNYFVTLCVFVCEFAITSAIDCLVTLASEVTCYMSNGALNPTYLLSTCISVVELDSTKVLRPLLMKLRF